MRPLFHSGQHGRIEIEFVGRGGVLGVIPKGTDLCFQKMGKGKRETKWLRHPGVPGPEWGGGSVCPCGSVPCLYRPAGDEYEICSGEVITNSKTPGKINQRCLKVFFAL